MAFEWLNYHHLLYFWLVVREGGLKPAGAVLRVSHSTVSAQIHALEAALGETLLVRKGRRLTLTDTGQMVYRYAGDIFDLGRELLDTVKGRPSGRPLRVEVGVADALPKLVVHRLLAPVRSLPHPVRIVCREGKHDRLLADLSVHAFDFVLAEAGVPSGSPIRAFAHPLGDCGITFFAANRTRMAPGPMPQALDDVAMVLPTENTSLRRALDAWFYRHGVRPRVVGEFEDAALLYVFGADGMGVFPAPSVIADDIARQHHVKIIGQTEDVRERFYAISMARKLQNAAVLAISTSAKNLLGG
jgi:LysR family transcriptional activator of nhaA